MKFEPRFKLKSGHLLFVLAGLGLVLIGMGVAGALGVDIPQKTASDVSNLVILGALGVLFYNRKLRAEENKAKAAQAAGDGAAKEKESAKVGESEAPADRE